MKKLLGIAALAALAASVFFVTAAPSTGQGMSRRPGETPDQCNARLKGKSCEERCYACYTTSGGAGCKKYCDNPKNSR